jgi:hypothetical protein
VFIEHDKQGWEFLGVDVWCEESTCLGYCPRGSRTDLQGVQNTFCCYLSGRARCAGAGPPLGDTAKLAAGLVAALLLLSATATV